MGDGPGAEVVPHVDTPSDSAFAEHGRRGWVVWREILNSS